MSPGTAGQCGAQGGGLQPQLHRHPAAAEAIILTTALWGPEEDGDLRQRGSTWQPELLLGEPLRHKEQSD